MSCFLTQTLFREECVVTIGNAASCYVIFYVGIDRIVIVQAII